MILNISNHDFSIVWEGVYYKALSNYPEINEWELKSIIDFVNYENEYGRETIFEIEDFELFEKVQSALLKPDHYNPLKKPSFITECTACKHKGCHTDFLCHTASLEHAISILESKKLLSAKNVREEDLEVLVNEARNAAKDPSDFFEYVMLSWGNCQAGDRLVVERTLNRLPNEEDLSINFKPGIRFYFNYDTLINHPNVKLDGYHALKIKDELELEPYLEAIIVPEAYQESFKSSIGEFFPDKIHYVKNDCKDIWDWSEKVYQYLLDVSSK